VTETVDNHLTSPTGDKDEPNFNPFVPFTDQWLRTSDLQTSELYTDDRK